jgi:hypothetical protein
MSLLLLWFEALPPAQDYTNKICLFKDKRHAKEKTRKRENGDGCSLLFGHAMLEGKGPGFVLVVFTEDFHSQSL